MKTTRLVTGILTLVFSVIVLFQSCAAGAYNALEANEEISGSAGFLVALLMVAGGIVSIATRNSSGKGGAIAALVIFLLGALVGFPLAGAFADLKIWAGWCLIMAIINAVLLAKKNKKEEVQ